MRILYLEDNDMHAELACITMQKTAPDFEVQIASTLAGAYQQIKHAHFDAALVDMRLPDGTGIEFIASVRNQNHELPIIVLTSLDDEITTVSALKAGADDYLIKWGDYLERVPEAIRAAMQRHQKEGPRRPRTLNITYVEHYEADAELTRRHFNQYAPHINLHILRDGNELLRLYKNNAECKDKCDVLLMDYRLPGLNALEIVTKLRNHSPLNIPVILITGQGSVDIAVQALRMGAVDYVVKQNGYLNKLPAMLENAYHLAQLERQRASLQQALEEQQRLTRELFHRTRNNMQVIHAIIEGQSLLVNEPHTINTLKNIQQRVKSLALVQELLYDNQHLSKIHLDMCLKQLCSELQRHNYVSDAQIHLELQLEPVSVLIDTALPCCMILTELLMNVYQHAYPDSQNGTVKIALHRSGEHELTLSISDDGIGVQHDFAPHAQKTFGLQSVVMMAEYQLQGSVSFETQNGFACTITLRDDLYEARV